MKNTFFELAKNLPVLLQNTHLNISLQGWPAAVAVVVVSLAGLTAYSLTVLNPETVEAPPEPQYSHMAA